ncbi:MAG: hypothetical protein EBR83_02970 [Verrucomicrobia bacterium]|nr:hypothetical protein [Verrucomicrobiota bacterium]
MSNKAPNPQGGKINSLQAAIDLVATGQPAFCLHQAWGIGVIRAYDEATKRLTVDFPEQNKKAHAMDAAFFLGKIEVINPNGVVAKAYADTSKAEIANQVANDPAGIVKALLAEYPTGECTSYALEANLDRIYFASLPAGKDRATSFKAWWTKARAALRKDRAILVPERKGGLYALLEAPKDLGEDLFAQYESAPNFERKLVLLEELADSASAETRSAATAANLDKVSADLAKEIKKLETARKRDNLPAILGGIWNRDKFFRSAVENVETVSPTASEIIALCTESDLAFVALNIPHTTEKIRSLLDLVRAHHGDNWAERAFDLLRNRDIGGTKSGSAKLVSESIAYLCDQELAAAVASRFAQWLETRELRAPVIIWVIKNRDSKKYADIVGRLINPSLLGAILSSIDTESLESNSTARIPLANAAMLAAEMSTDSGYMLTWATVIYNDLITPCLRKPLAPKQQLLLTRLLVLAIAIFLLFYGLWYELPGNAWDYLAVTGNIYLASVFTLLVAGLYWPRGNATGAGAALILGAIGPLAFLILGRTYPIAPEVAGASSFGLAALGMIVGSLLTPAPSTQ